MTAFRQIVRLASRALAVSAVVTAILSGETRAAWPERPITIIVPFPAGGATDLLGRLLAAELTFKLGANVTVENRVGEVGSVGLRAAAMAAGNGYTLLVTTNAALINIAINPRLTETSYNTPKDFSPIAYLGAAPNIIVTRPSSGIASIADLIAKARADPGKLTYATPGIGSSSEMAVALLKLRTGIHMRSVTFNGSEPSLMAVVSSANIASIGIGGLIGHIRSGEIKGLVQTGAERWFDLPDVPTMAEAGIPDLVVETSQMFAAPRGTPEPIIYSLTKATQEILQRPSIKAKMLKAGFLVQYEGPDELHARVSREIAMWKAVVESAGMKKQ